MLYKVTAGDCDFHVSLDNIENELLSGGFEEDFSLLALPYSAFDEIDLRDEIVGETDCLTGLAALSGNKSATVFCGITTKIMNLRHVSVAVCHKGRLVDVVDRTANVSGEYFESSQKIKIYSTGTARIAVLVDKDVLIERNWEKVVPYCDVVLAIVMGSDEATLAAAEAVATKSGVAYVIVNDVSVLSGTPPKNGC